jgi:hypothetical protein
VQYPVQQNKNKDSSIEIAEVFKKARKEKYDKYHYSCYQKKSAAISIILFLSELSLNLRNTIYIAISFIHKKYEKKKDNYKREGKRDCNFYHS